MERIAVTSLPQPIVDRLIRGVGLSTLPAEQRAKMLQRLEAILDKALTIRIFAILSHRQKDDLQVQLEAAADPADARDRFRAYVVSAIPNLATVLDEEVDKLISGFDAIRMNRPGRASLGADQTSSDPRPGLADPLAAEPQSDFAAELEGCAIGAAIESLEPDSPELFGLDDLAADLASGPSAKVLSTSERMRWVVDKTTSTLMKGLILVWLYAIAIVLAKRFAVSGILRRLPEWATLLLPQWLSRLAVVPQLLILVSVGLMSLYLLMRLRAALMCHYNDHGANTGAKW